MEESAEVMKSLGGRSNEQQQVVAGRTFTQRGVGWEDAAQRVGQRTVEIQAFSPAYFQVLQQLPELGQYWKQMQDVLVAGGKVSVRVSKTGTQQISAAELKRLVTEFRAQ
jgi:hypothetical protein